MFCVLLCYRVINAAPTSLPRHNYVITTLKLQHAPRIWTCASSMSLVPSQGIYYMYVLWAVLLLIHLSKAAPFLTFLATFWLCQAWSQKNHVDNNYQHKARQMQHASGNGRNGVGLYFLGPPSKSLTDITQLNYVHIKMVGIMAFHK